MIEDIHTLAIPALIFDPATYFILDANQMFVDVYGYSLEELKQMHVVDLRPPEGKQDAIGLLESTRGNVLYSGESTHQKKNGEKIQAQVFGKRYFENNKEYYLVKVKLK
ncbi:MAG: PAS domain-containing protein [Bacteroidota bacterium]